MLVLRQADVLVAVFNPAKNVVEHTAATLAYLQDEGISEERFYLLSNRPLGVEDLSPNEVATGLGRPADGSVPHLADNMYMSNLVGIPVKSRLAHNGSGQRLQSTVDDLAARIHAAVRAGQ